jgi:hypothetical protein
MAALYLSVLAVVQCRPRGTLKQGVATAGGERSRASGGLMFLVA